MNGDHHGDGDPARPLTFFGGKGGVGKTTIAAACAVAWSGRGQRTLLVSTDPAHSTADLLGAGLGDEPVEVGDGLWAAEIDAVATADRYVAEVAATARRTVSPAVFATVERHLELARHGPGTLESALLDRLGDLLDWCPDRVERVVVDTAPTGHTLRLLAMPALLTDWIEGLVRQRDRVRGMDRMLRNLAGDDAPPDDPLLERLRVRRDRTARLRRRLVDEAVFHPVLLPERLPIEETARSLATLREAGITVGQAIVNRVLPDTDGGDYLRQRRAQQQTYLDEIDHRLSDLDARHVLQAPRDISSPADLDAVAAQLDGL